MKQPKKLSRKQKEVVSANRLNPDNWMLLEETQGQIRIINKTTKKSRLLDKIEKGGRRRYG